MKHPFQWRWRSRAPGFVITFLAMAMFAFGLTVFHASVAPLAAVTVAAVTAVVVATLTAPQAARSIAIQKITHFVSRLQLQAYLRGHRYVFTRQVMSLAVLAGISAFFVAHATFAATFAILLSMTTMMITAIGVTALLVHGAFTKRQSLGASRAARIRLGVIQA